MQELGIIISIVSPQPRHTEHPCARPQGIDCDDEEGDTCGSEDGLEKDSIDGSEDEDWRVSEEEGRGGCGT